MGGHGRRGAGTPGRSDERGERLAPRPWDRLVGILRGPGWARVALLRRVGAATLAGIAVVLALAPDPSSEDAPVLVTVRDLAPGTAVRAADLTVRRYPSALVPTGALHAPADADGRVVAGAVRSGEPLTDLRLVGAALTARAGGPEAAAVPLRPADPAVAALLAPGTVVDVVTLGGEQAQGGEQAHARVVAGRATVLTVLPDGTQGPGRTSAGPLVLVALPREDATTVAAASLAGEIAVTLR